MRRRIRPATEDLEPRVVLSMGSLTPRPAEPPVEDTHTESPTEAAPDEISTPIESGTTDPELVDSTPISGDSTPVIELVDNQPNDVDDRTEPDNTITIDTEPADVVTAADVLNVNTDALKKVARLKRLRHNHAVDTTPTAGVVTDVAPTETEPADTHTTVIADIRNEISARPVEPVHGGDGDSRDEDVDTGLGDITDVRDVTDGEEIEATPVQVNARTQHEGDTESTHTANVTGTTEAAELIAAAREVSDLGDRGIITLQATAARAADETSEADTISTPSATSWIDSLHSSALSWFGPHSDVGTEVEPLAEHSASAAGVAGILSLMAFGRRGMADSERLFSGAFRGLLDWRDWRPSRSTNRRRQKPIPGESTRKEPVAVAPENLDEPDLSNAFLMSVAVPVSPDAFAMSAIPADAEGVESENSKTDMVAATAAVSATVAAGGWAARQRSGGRQSKPSARPQIDFGGTTFTRPQHRAG